MNRLYRLEIIEKKLQIANFSPLDVFVIGGTGSGKSSTINAVFEQEIAKVGKDCDPETMQISSMVLNDYMRFWDSPGLGDNVDRDNNYAKNIIDMLYREYRAHGERYGYIDLVLLILDGSGRDMGTTYSILNNIVVPNFQPDRILVAINQADLAMKGRHWDEEKNQPDDVLKKFLEEKVTSIQKRILEATGVNVSKPVYYSAEKAYHIEKLLDLLIDNMPLERRKLMDR